MTPSADTPAGVLAQLAAMDWDFDADDTSAGGHDLHPYPAKFPPQIPRRIIDLFSKPGDLVLDPFGGSGTTALEALRLNRRIALIDANPVATLIAQLKINPPRMTELGPATRFITEAPFFVTEIATCDFGGCPSVSTVPSISNIEKWFDGKSVHELAHIKHVVEGWTANCRKVGLLALGQTAARISFQESETRYVSKTRVVHAGDAVRVFVRELARLLAHCSDGAALANSNDSVVQCGDARVRNQVPLSDGTVDLIVTSPPYPNAYDYHLYHRFRLLWTGFDPKALRAVEIGSHLRQQSVADPIADYELDMTQVLQNAFYVLKSGAWCVFVVGDGKYSGQLYRTSAAISRIGQELGFEIHGELTRNLPAHRRSVTHAGRRLKQEQLVFLRKPADPVFHDPPWQLFEYEALLSARERELLGRRPSQDSTESSFSRLAFSRGVTLGDKTVLTFQQRLESQSLSRRKNSTYATHGLHRYKGKFYPQLGRCLLNLSCDEGSLVVDPFAGSGTIALEAALSGIRCHAIELNPVGAATARAKTSALNVPENILKMTTRQLRLSVQSKAMPVDWSLFPLAVHKEISSWFPATVLGRISNILKVVERVEHSSEFGATLSLLARVCLSDVIREVSHQDPADLRIRRRPEPLSDAPVEDLFLTRWDRAMAGILWTQKSGCPISSDIVVVAGDSSDPQNWPQVSKSRDEALLVDAVITSPPYAAALPYLDTDRLSLAVVFGSSKTDRALLEGRLIGSREISTQSLRSWREMLVSGTIENQLPSSTLSFLTALTESVDSDSEAGFRKRQTPAVLTRYFVMMSCVLRNVAQHLRVDGNAWFVMGDSRTTVSGKPWQIPTTQEVAAIAKHWGLQAIEEIPITVTRENMRHAKNAITKNTLLHFQRR